MINISNTAGNGLSLYNGVTLEIRQKLLKFVVKGPINRNGFK